MEDALLKAFWESIKSNPLLSGAWIGMGYHELPDDVRACLKAMMDCAERALFDTARAYSRNQA